MEKCRVDINMKAESCRRSGGGKSYVEFRRATGARDIQGDSMRHKQKDARDDYRVSSAKEMAMMGFRGIRCRDLDSTVSKEESTLVHFLTKPLTRVSSYFYDFTTSRHSYHDS